MVADLSSHLSDLKSKVNLSQNKFDIFVLKKVANIV